MPIYHLKPVLAQLEHPEWAASQHKAEAWVDAADEAEARGLAAGRFDDANANLPGVAAAPSPWQSAQLVTVEELAEPPNGMAMVPGVVAYA